MAKFIDTLTHEQKSNIVGLIDCMKRNGIHNVMMQAGILAVISKESTFVPKAEKDYAKTDNARIRSIFGSRVKGLDEAQLTALKKDPKAFFDLIYGGRYGNGPDEGYKYRGRGFNQLTFKANYEKTAERIHIDLVTYPDKLNEVPVATEAVISFFLEKFADAPKAKLAQWNMTDINGSKSIEDAVNAAYNANTGWGKTKEQILNEKTGGYAKATARVAAFYEVTSGKLDLTGNAKPASESAPTVAAALETSSSTHLRTKFVCVKSSSLNVRTKPDGKSNQVTDRSAAMLGEILAVYSVQKGWYKISDSKEQWVSAKYCVDVKRAVVTVDSLNVRTGPAKDAPKKGSLKRGTEVFVSEQKDGWGKLGVAEQWVSLEFLKF